MSVKPPITVHWFRRDLRTDDNHALFRALSEHGNVLPLFIFDTTILGKLEDRDDRRVDFLHRALTGLKEQLEQRGGSLLVLHGDPLAVWRDLLDTYTVRAVTAVHDHEPYAGERDRRIGELLKERGIPFHTFKDISIFERSEVMKDDGGPYTVFTPYARKWRARFVPSMADPFPSEAHLHALAPMGPLPMPTLAEIGFRSSDAALPPPTVPDRLIAGYDRTRDLPGTEGTTRLGVHLRFGTVSVRALVRRAIKLNATFLNELIWREFFMQVLWHFPHPERAFKPAYDAIPWRQAPGDFERWCAGDTGYPLVDAGMRELKATGFMHNRVRMVTASFLTKHLLIDWRLGEAWFARHLLDFELSSNNGGWQWASSSGCDAAPYFRVFNPTLQQERFDPALTYVNRWVPDFRSTNYPRPMVVHSTARARAIATYREALEGSLKKTTQHTIF